MTLEFTVPPDLTFEQAIALTQDLLSASQDDDLWNTAVQSLIATPNGARAFFAVFLTGDYPMPAGLPRVIRSNPQSIATLLIKNLVMSSTMAIAHHQNGNEDLAASSRHTRDRTAHLIQQLNLPELYNSLTDLQTTLTQPNSLPNDWHQFLDRQGYDDDQRTAIGKTIQAALAVQAS